MAAEVLELLAPARAGLYVDATVGAGGHASLILEASAPEGRLLGLDRDPRALELAGRRLAPQGSRVELIEATFDQLPELLKSRGIEGAQGILVDLGVSSMQLDNPERGFAFRQDGPLDMRMSSQGSGAMHLVAQLGEKELARLLAELGEEPFARRIARRLVQAREEEPITSTARLARLVSEALPMAEQRRRKLHPATQTFMALRMAINDELGQLERFLEHLPACLVPGGRVAIISYHSLEDRRVKKSFARLAAPCTCPPRLPVCACGKRPWLNLLTRGARRPTQEEVDSNPRARSARLRAAQRTAEAWS